MSETDVQTEVSVEQTNKLPPSDVSNNNIEDVLAFNYTNLWPRLERMVHSMSSNQLRRFVANIVEIPYLRTSDTLPPVGNIEREAFNVASTILQTGVAMQLFMLHDNGLLDAKNVQDVPEVNNNETENTNG